MAHEVLHSGRLRPIDTREDLLPVADLIELCFGDQMDQDGREYIRQIRRAAKDIRYQRWVPGSGERISLPLHGYVWEEDGILVGNLTLIPVNYQNRWNYLIANVAVHPDFRRRGIARHLTEMALHHVESHKAHSAWLHVRHDNFPAINLYQSLGLQERAERTTWQSKPETLNENSNHHFLVTRRSSSDWSLQNKWLNRVYPPEVTWNLPFRVARFKPGFWPEMVRFLNNDRMLHWSAYLDRKLTGVVSWEPGHLNSDTLWLAVDSTFEESTVYSLLTHSRKYLARNRTLQVNYPAGHADAAFFQAGFEKLNTLIWMEKRFR